MFGIHPIRWIMRSAMRKFIVAAMLVSGTGTTGATMFAPDSVPGQLGTQFVHLTEYAVNKITEPSENTQPVRLTPVNYPAQ